MIDLTFENHGTLGLCRPMTDDGRKFLDETAPEDAQFCGDAMVFEPRYFDGIYEAAVDYGLVLDEGDELECIGDVSVCG